MSEELHLLHAQQLAEIEKAYRGAIGLGRLRERILKGRDPHILQKTTSTAMDPEALHAAQRAELEAEYGPNLERAGMPNKAPVTARSQIDVAFAFGHTAVTLSAGEDKQVIHYTYNSWGGHSVERAATVNVRKLVTIAALQQHDTGLFTIHELVDEIWPVPRSQVIGMNNLINGLARWWAGRLRIAARPVVVARHVTKQVTHYSIDKVFHVASINVEPVPSAEQKTEHSV